MSVPSIQSIQRPSGIDALRARVDFGADSLASQILNRNASSLGFDLAGLSSDLGAITRQNPELGGDVGALIQTQLTPVEIGQLLSGRFGGASQSPLQAPTLYDQTLASIDADRLDNDQNDRIAALIDQGYSFPETSRMGTPHR